MAFLTDADRERIRAAIRAAETRTSGEFVAVVARESADRSVWVLAFASVAALVTPWIIAAGPWWGVDAALVQLLVFAVLLALGWLTPLGRWLVPPTVQHAAVQDAAARLYVAERIGATAGGTGVLLFVSVAERSVVVLADPGIAARVPAGFWDDIVAAFTTEVRAGRVAEGFIRAVEQGGEALARNFPRAADDRDELPDHLIEI
jgi:putative membrane protein